MAALSPFGNGIMELWTLFADGLWTNGEMGKAIKVMTLSLYCLV